MGTAIALAALSGTGTIGMPESPWFLQVDGTRTPLTVPVPSSIPELSDARHSSQRGHLPAGLRSERDGVRWLHDESGLTWDQLGRLFGVSRRTVHLWASGSGMNAVNAETLYDLIRLVSSAEGASPRERRVALLRPGPDGRSALDQFRAARAARNEQINAPAWRPEALLDTRHDLAVTEA